ncbi:MAG: hypothetical protein IJG47_02595, partial [Microbacterium sp.]|nr:hypothetical protein [Microbacterium sp.]
MMQTPPQMPPNALGAPSDRGSAERVRAAAAGLAAATLGVGAAELVAALIAPEASPVAVIGGGLIDLA